MRVGISTECHVLSTMRNGLLTAPVFFWYNLMILSIKSCLSFSLRATALGVSVPVLTEFALLLLIMLLFDKNAVSYEPFCLSVVWCL